MNDLTHEVYFHDDFDKVFVDDLRNAKRFAVIQSPFLEPRRIEMVSAALKECVGRGVRLCVFAQIPSDGDFPGSLARRYRREAGAQMLLSMGIHVTFRDEIHEKLIVVDERIAWEGSLNILSFNKTRERMTRWDGRDKADEITRNHGLDACLHCWLPADLHRFSDNLSFNDRERKIIGTLFVQRRRALGLSQAQLSSGTGISQNIISAIELGKREVRVSTVLRICRALKLTMRPTPYYRLPSSYD